MSNLKKLLITIIIAIIALIAEFIFHQPTIAFWIVTILGGIMTVSLLQGMIKTLKSGKYGIDILAITAIVATLAVGEYWASLMVLVMLTGGDSLEDYASRQASKELRTLLKNSPEHAHKLINEKIEDIAIDAVKINDILVVRPGEMVPVDGIILTGNSFFDESSLTGESKPIEKNIADEIMSGSINGEGAIHYRVTKIAQDSQYQTLVKLVKESQEKPAKFVRLADRYAVPFTIIAYIIGGVAWFVSKDPKRFAEVLVVASPCPLILAAPIALVAGMSRTSRNGIVVKTGTTIEKLATAKSIAFDKTGTVTEGALFVDEIKPIIKLDKETFLILAASAERDSSHILARSLLNYVKEKKLDLLPTENLEEITGSGIKAFVNKKEIIVGKAALVQATKTAETDQTAIYVSIDGTYAGFITFKDIVRPESKSTIATLKKIGLQHIMMITGDKKSIANQIAEQVGINEVHSECLPKDKIQILTDVKTEDRPVIMVGDGINDAPALAIADIGIAMGAHGSNAASESADAVILKDDLSKVATAIEISQETMKIAKQAVLTGIFICIILMIIAATGVIPALLGAALQEIVDTVSILSALRARKDKKITN